jgi:hypothetical protein
MKSGLQQMQWHCQLSWREATSIAISVTLTFEDAFARLHYAL